MLVGGGGAGGTVIDVRFLGVGLGVGAAYVSETSAVASPAVISKALMRRRGWGRSFFICRILVQHSQPVNGNFEKICT